MVDLARKIRRSDGTPFSPGGRFLQQKSPPPREAAGRRTGSFCLFPYGAMVAKVILPIWKRNHSMRLTKQSNYAVRILMYCAANTEELSKVTTIAQVYDVSEYFLFKILKPLVDNGYVATERGRAGGIRLAKPANEMRLGEVIRATEDKFIMAECFEEGADCPLLSSCAFNSALTEALGAFFTVLDSYTIADLVENKSRVRELLGMFGLNEAGQVADA